MPTAAKLRWGILGVAKINNRLLPAFKTARNADLRAIASRSTDKAKAATAAAGIPTAHGSYDALLADPGIDAVYIPLPNTLHDEWTRKAAEAGKHVLCEKPLTPTAPEAEALVEFCQSKGVRLMDGFMWPHHPRTRQLRKLIDSGAIGPVRRVTGAFTFLLPLDPANIRLQPATAGGSLLDVGCYPVYGIRWAFGAEPKSVRATATYRHGVDLNLTGTMDFGDGRAGVFDCGFDLPMRQWLEITGTEGVIRVPEMWVPDKPVSFELQRGEGPREWVTSEDTDQIACMLEDFGDAVLTGRDPLPLPDEAVKSLRVMDALAKSAREGREVAV
jgi:xylose dehydrogenase (NAD/NADP)